MDDCVRLAYPDNCLNSIDMDPSILSVGEVYEAVASDIPVQGMFRLLEIQPRIDWATIIPIPQAKTSAEGKQKNYYAKGFERVRFTILQSWLAARIIKHAVLAPPAFWNLDDAQLCERLRGGPDHPEEKPSALRTRDFKWGLLEPILPPPYGTGRQVPHLQHLDALVKKRAREAHVSPGLLFDALHRFYASGCMLNGLLPNRIGRCGNPGKRRLGKNGIKLGRKNAAAKLGDSEKRGLPLTEEDLQNIQDAYQLIGPGMSVPDAYCRMNEMFYSSGYELQHGVPVPQLFPAHQRPTFTEFKYRGPQGQNAIGAARRLMGEGEWLKNRRPLSGTARDGVTAIAQMGSVDASPIDVHLVSCFNPTQPIGVSRAVLVRDVYSGLFLGWSLSIDNPTSADAKLAILRAAESKKKLLEKYDLDFPDDDFPAMFFGKYLSDNGELRCNDALISITGEELKGGLEFIPSHRADRNSVSETGHQGRHKTLDHKLPATTKGRQRNRGEVAPITAAVLSRFSYTRQLLRWIHWYNTQKPVALSEIPSEMRRDFSSTGLQLPKNRIGIFRWARDNGYVVGRPTPLDNLRAHLLPKYKASLNRDGVTLHRPGVGSAVELLRAARFNAPYLIESGLMRSAISRKVIHIDVRADPDDLSYIYIIDDKGIHPIPNIKSDPLLDSIPEIG